jgi:hypothetical protein
MRAGSVVQEETLFQMLRLRVECAGIEYMLNTLNETVQAI